MAATREDTISVSSTIKRRGDVVVTKIVNKNLLTAQGDIIVGTGGFQTLGTSATGTEDIANVTYLTAGSNGLPLVANSAVTGKGLEYAPLTSVGLAPDAVTTEKINASAVTTEKINAGAVTNVKLGSLAVETENINAGAVTNVKLGALAVETGNINASAVTATKIKIQSINSEHFATTAIAPYADSIRSLSSPSRFSVFFTSTGFQEIPNTSGTTWQSCLLVCRIKPVGQTASFAQYMTSLAYFSTAMSSTDSTGVTVWGSPVYINESSYSNGLYFPAFTIKGNSSSPYRLNVSFNGFYSYTGAELATSASGTINFLI